MGDISNAIEALKEDFEAADGLVVEIYDKYFTKYFQKEVELYTKFQDTDIAITDGELEWILLSLPLDLKAASNALAQFKQHNEIVKLKIKQRKNSGDADDLDEEFKLMTIIYSSVITRVESDISFSKELIMGAKKVWDARRRTEQVNPVNEINTELPEYTADQPF
jgi:hypothetical protein